MISRPNYSSDRPVLRGEIYYVEKSPNLAVGSEMYSARPAVVVSNNINNKHSNVIEVVYMSTSPKMDMPTHVKLDNNGRKSIVCCEQIHSVDKKRLGDFYGSVSDREMAEIERALLVSLDLNKDVSTQKSPEVIDSPDLTKAIIERDMYKQMYEDLMTRIMAK